MPLAAHLNSRFVTRPSEGVAASLLTAGLGVEAALGGWVPGGRNLKPRQQERPHSTTGAPPREEAPLSDRKTKRQSTLWRVFDGQAKHNITSRTGKSTHLATRASQKGSVPLVHHDHKVLTFDAVAAATHFSAGCSSETNPVAKPRRPGLAYALRATRPPLGVRGPLQLAGARD